jgi:hypothetical protein
VDFLSIAEHVIAQNNVYLVQKAIIIMFLYNEKRLALSQNKFRKCNKMSSKIFSGVHLRAFSIDILVIMECYSKKE